MKGLSEAQIAALFGRSVENVVVRDHLVTRLKEGKKLRIKIGMDPTAPDLHLGHAVALRLLRRFQDAGHTVVFIIGDATALIGDPSGKSKTRPQLDAKEIDRNAKTYFAQVGKILDVKKAEVRYNSEWLGKLKFADVIRLAAKFTVARILERDDFAKRYKSGIDISAHELLYPMMQAYDSVAIKADVEVGGTDQTFNMLAGRELQKKMDMSEQDVLTVPLLVGIDGVNKMSKSLGNYVGLSEKPEDMYGKVMSIPDALIPSWFMLATELTDAEIAEAARVDNPRDRKMRLAREIVVLYHGAKAAEKAEATFVSVFQKRETPADVVEMRAKNNQSLVDLLIVAKLAASKSEARRLVEQNGVKLDGAVAADPTAVITLPKSGVLLQKGKRHFVRVIPS
ncbi:tyrosine--tRNA ligase [Patescibacteria group bacterium]|nr:MAG: tyrosine--tRNA ligase [Patescibacteria group bacterium]